MELLCSYCGNTFERVDKEIQRQQKRGHTEFYCGLSCACSRNNQRQRLLGRKHSGGRLKGWGNPFREYLRRARLRKKTIGATVEHLKEVWEKQQGRCAYTGVPLIHASSQKNITSPHFQASLDRINSSEGYEIGNLQFISKTANFAKSDFSDEVFKEFLDIVRHS